MNQVNLNKISLEASEEHDAVFESLFVEAKAIKNWADICPIYQKVKPILAQLKKLPKIGKYIELLMLAMDALCKNESPSQL